MSYRVEFTSAAKRQLKEMDRFDASLILNWIEKNLENCADPRAHGKGLTANRSGSGVTEWDPIGSSPSSKTSAWSSRCSRSGTAARYTASA